MVINKILISGTYALEEKNQYIAV